MQCRILAKGREVRSRKEETKSEEKDPAGLAEYANSPPPASPPAASPLAASPSSQSPSSSSASSNPNFEGHKPFWQPDYPSQRFRPEVSEAEDPNDLCYSPPPQLFSPPMSPDQVHLQHIIPDKASPAGPSAISKVRD